MRRLGLLLVLVFGLLAPAARATAPVLMWHLDSGSTGGQVDSSGNGYSGSTQAVERVDSGRWGRAWRLGFPGAGSAIGRFDGAAFDTAGMSTTLWVRNDGAPGAGKLESYGVQSCGSPSWSVDAVTNGATQDVRATVVGATGTVVGSTVPGAQLWDGDWHGIVVTYGAVPGLHTFVDGAEVGTGTAGKGAIHYADTSSSKTGFRVGALGVCGDNTAPTVDVDEARFYGTALDASEASYLTNRFHVVPPLGPEVPNTETLVHYPLDILQDINADHALDDSGHGVASGHTTGTIDSTGGKFFGRLDLVDGTGGFDARSSIFEPNRVAVIAWVKKGSAPANAAIAGKGVDAQCHAAYGLETDGTGAVRFRLAGASNDGTQHSAFLTPTAAATGLWDGNWHAVGGVYRDGEISLWVDGAFAGATPVPADRSVIDYPATTAGRAFSVGRGGPGCMSDGFGGLVDEVSVYGRGLADDEMSYLTKDDHGAAPHLPAPEPPAPAEPEPGLVLKWHLDKTNGPSVTDVSGNDFRGTLSHTTPANVARFKGGLTLQPDGTTPATISHGSETALKPDKVTLLLWVRGTDPKSAVIAGQGGAGQCGYGAYGLSVITNVVVFGVNGTIAPGGESNVVVPGTVFDGQWHMLAGTYDRTKVRLYIDGAPVGDGKAYTAPIDYTARPGGFTVGAPAGGCNDASELYAGDVDEVRVYNRALTPDEIAYLGAGFHRTPPKLPEPTGPKNTRPPGVYGIPAVGNVLACDPGDWNPADVTRQYLWERAPRGVKVAGDAAWAPIDGAADQGYEVRPEDAGSRVRCRELATKSGITAEAISFNTKRTDTGVPDPDGLPVIEGLPAKAGKELTCDEGHWANSQEASDFTYIWDRDGTTVGTQRTYTPKPLHPIALGGIGTDPNGDSNHDLTCIVKAANDVGESPFVERSKPVFVAEGAPNLQNSPQATLPPAADGSGNPLKQAAQCSTGDWFDDYAQHPGSVPPGDWSYRYQWYRPAVGADNTTLIPISGATSASLPITPELLGRSVRCSVVATNAFGSSPEARSGEVFIPLPAPAATGYIEERFRNEYDPVDMLAASDTYRENIKIVARDRITALIAGMKKQCPPTTADSKDVKAVYAALPSALDPTSLAQLHTICYVLNAKPSDVERVDNSLYWDPGDKFPSCGVASKPCRPILLNVPVADDQSAPTLTAAEQAALAPETPTTILWDIDGDNRTDIACPGSSPAIRAHLNAGRYQPQAILVMPDSASTGRFVRVQTRAVNAQGQHFMYFPDINAGRNPGSYRKPQPLWCRNTIVPPPDPASAPCVTTGSVGQVLLQGNLCPINSRSVDQNQLDGMPPEVKAVVKQAADEINSREAANRLYEKGATDGLRRFAQLRDGAFRSTAAGNVAAAAENFAGIQAQIATQAVESNLDKEMATRMQDLKAGTAEAVSKAGALVPAPQININVPKAGFALDQIYTTTGPLKVNGTTILPGAGFPAIVSPSDVTQALTDAPKKMLLNAQNAAIELGKRQLTKAREDLKVQFDDAVNGAAKTLKDNINLDAIDPSKLDLGPFNLAGLDAKVTLNADQTATLHAQAKLPGLSMSAPGAKKVPASIAVDIRAGLDGSFQLQGLKITVGEAFLFGINLHNFSLTYDSTTGLSASGQITFDFLGGSGIDIIKFHITNEGKLDALQVDYTAGAGTGIVVGPGVFLTRVGGGFQAPDPIELHGDAALSMSPSIGKGCPTVGARAQLTFHASPAPITLHSDGEVQLVCIPLGKVTFDVSSEGTADLTAHGDINVPSIVKINADLGGHVRTKDPAAWQIDGKGSVDFSFLPKPIGLKGVFSNKGIAACAHVTIPIPWPFDDLNLAAGAAVKFSGGLPPITFPQLVANFRAFSGCDLGEFTPLHALRIGRAANAPQTFALDSESTALSIEGAGAAPKVTVISPSGKRYDFTDAEHGKFLEGAFGAIMATEDRTVVMLRHPERGMWKAESADGSTPIVRIQQADVLPKPSVTGKVTGTGTKRVLHYSIKKIPGQQVMLTEEANKAGMQALRTVTGGGKGKLKFTVTEAGSKARTIAAQVVQNGLPRTRIVVARFSAPNPGVGKPKVHIRRKGTKAMVTWSKAANTVRYDVTLRYADGRTDLFRKTAKQRSVSVAAVGKQGGLTAYVTGYSAASHRGKTAVGKLKQVKPKPHHKHKKKKGKKK